MLLDSFLPSRTLSSMKICKLICCYVANRGSRKLCGGFRPPQGGYARSAVFRVAQRLCAVGAEDQCAFSSCGNNALLVTDLKTSPLPRWLADGTKKRSSSRLTHRYSWWSWRGSNSRPLECHSSALPAELQPHTFGFRLRVVHLTHVFDQCQYIFLDILEPRHNNRRRAGVVKLVDAGDSKSPDPRGHVGSIPTSGTK
jgi:hypothetical protein